MNITVDAKGESQVAVVESDDILIGEVQEALDLMAAVRYTTGCDKMVIHKKNITEDFFDLKTRLAGDILQKYTNYQMKIAIVGDFDVYESKSLRDFIYECNQGRSIFFLKDKQAALEALHRTD